MKTKKTNIKKHVKDSLHVKRKRVKPYTYNLQKHRAKTLSLLSQFIPFSQIAKIQNSSTSAVYRLFYRLVKDNLITRKKELTEEGLNHVKEYLVVSNHVKDFYKKPNQIRLHDLQFTVGLLNKPKGWDKQRQTILNFKNIKHKSWNIKNSIIQELFVEGIRVRTTTQNILVLLDDIYAGNPKEAKNRAINNLYNILPKIENIFNIKLEKPNSCNIKVSRQHNALIYNEIAKLFLEAGISLKIYDEDGNIRLIVDDSEKLKELEAVNPIKSEEDSEKVQEFLKDLIINKHYPISDISKKVSSLVMGIEILTKLTVKLGQSQHQSTEILNSSIKIQNNTLTILDKLLQQNKGEDDEPKFEGKSDYFG